MFNDILTVWSNQPGISATIWLAILVFVAYLGRKPAHATDPFCRNARFTSAAACRRLR